MRSRKRWVGVAALCMVAVVPEAHAQIVAPAGTQPAANLPADLSAQGVAGQAQLAAAAHRAAVANAAARAMRQGTAAGVPSAVTVRAQAAVSRAAKLESLSASVSLAQAAARSFAAGTLPAVQTQAQAQAPAMPAAAPQVGIVGTPAQASALTRATRLDTMSGEVSAANAAARAMAAGFGTASTSATAAGTTSGRSAVVSPFASLSPHATWSLQAFTLPQRVASDVAAAGVNAAVVVRHPAQNFGSGYLSSYATLNHMTSSARGFRAAAADPNGCLVVGDSIGARTAPELDALARQEFGSGCAYEVWNGRPTEGAVNALAQIAKTHGLPKRVVMISGANDIFNPPAFRAQVERAAAIVGPKRTLTWASVFVRRPLTGTAAADLENSRWLNILLSRVVARHENIRVVNWYGFLAARQRRLSSYLLDGVHPTPEGRRALAQLIADRW